jgi:hypothetical protein
MVSLITPRAVWAISSEFRDCPIAILAVNSTLIRSGVKLEKATGSIGLNINADTRSLHKACTIKDEHIVILILAG